MWKNEYARERNLGRILNRGEGSAHGRNGEFGLAWEHQKFIRSSGRKSENTESHGGRQIGTVVEVFLFSR